MTEFMASCLTVPLPERLTESAIDNTVEPTSSGGEMRLSATVFTLGSVLVALGVGGSQRADSGPAAQAAAPRPAP